MLAWDIGSNRGELPGRNKIRSSVWWQQSKTKAQSKNIKEKNKPMQADKVPGSTGR